MNKISLDEILIKAHEMEFSRYDNPLAHKFSIKHSRAMKRIFSIYQKNTSHFYKDNEKTSEYIIRYHWSRKKVLIIAIIAFLAILAGCAAVFYSLGGFSMDIHKEYTKLFPIDLNDCPETIEYVYYLPELPEGYEIFDKDQNDVYVYTAYINNDTGQTITIIQYVKSYFESHYNTEYNEFEKITIGQHIGIGLAGKNAYVIVWDNGDYVIEVSADLTKEDVLKLAKNTKVFKNENLRSQMGIKSDLQYRGEIVFPICKQKFYNQMIKT